uniref:Uncharacterized protein n=1 Tax=Arundo donax TaxID=35708 RepID=A0A0A8XUH8_ARUDO
MSSRTGTFEKSTLQTNGIKELSCPNIVRFPNHTNYS